MLKKIKSSQKGMSTLEVLPILLMFAVLINFTLGFFGIIHAGILSNIGARNYAFETFRNRANLNYLRDDPDTIIANDAGDVNTSIRKNYNKAGLRFHAIGGNGTSADRFIPVLRSTKFSNALERKDDIIGNRQDHLDVGLVQEGKKASEVYTGKTKGDGRAGLDPVWIKTIYGICLNSDCRRAK